MGFSLGVGLGLSKPGASVGGGGPTDYIARWTMDDATGADETGNYDGTWSGPGSISTITGVINDAQQPTSSSPSSGYQMSVASFPTVKGGLRSFAGWVRVNSPGGSGQSRYIISQAGGVSLFQFNTTFYITLANSTAGTNLFQYTRTTTDFTTLGDFVHIAVVSDGVVTTSGAFTIYINGVDDTSNWTRAAGSGSVTNDTNELVIGNLSSADRYSNAGHDDYRFYTIQLDTTDVSFLYNWRP